MPCRSVFASTEVAPPTAFKKTFDGDLDNCVSVSMASDVVSVLRLAMVVNDTSERMCSSNIVDVPAAALPRRRRCSLVLLWLEQERLV